VWSRKSLGLFLRKTTLENYDDKGKAKLKLGDVLKETLGTFQITNASSRKI